MYVHTSTHCMYHHKNCLRISHARVLCCVGTIILYYHPQLTDFFESPAEGLSQCTYTYGRRACDFTPEAYLSRLLQQKQSKIAHRRMLEQVIHALTLEQRSILEQACSIIVHRSMVAADSLVLTRCLRYCPFSRKWPPPQIQHAVVAVCL